MPGRRTVMSVSKVPMLSPQSMMQGRRGRGERAPRLVTQFARLRLEDVKLPQAGTFLPFPGHFLAQEVLLEQS